MKHVFAILLAILGLSSARAQEATCFDKVSSDTQNELRTYFSDTLKAEVSVSTSGIYGGGRWSNGPFLVDQKHFEQVPYDTYEIETIVYVNGGRGRPKGYRMDPLVQVRTNSKTCEILKVIAINIHSDSRAAKSQILKDGFSFPTSMNPSVEVYDKNQLKLFVEGVFPIHRVYYSEQ